MNVSITIVMVLIAIIATMSEVIYILVNKNKETKKKISELQCKYESAKINVTQLSDYIDKILKIKNENISISQKIKEAENDEEVYNIIASIVSDNNKQLQNNRD